MKTRTQKIVLASMIAALCCIATMTIKIPTLVKGGYLNLGDSIVLLAGWLLSPMYGFLAAGLGSALADVFLGYFIYAPATFVIKGLMAVVVFCGCRYIKKKKASALWRVATCAVAEMVMVFGYFIFEIFLYGFATSALNIPMSAIQGVAGLIVGIALIKIFEKRL